MPSQRSGNWAEPHMTFPTTRATTPQRHESAARARVLGRRRLRCQRALLDRLGRRLAAQPTTAFLGSHRAPTQRFPLANAYVDNGPTHVSCKRLHATQGRSRCPQGSARRHTQPSNHHHALRSSPRTSTAWPRWYPSSTNLPNLSSTSAAPHVASTTSPGTQRRRRRRWSSGAVPAGAAPWPCCSSAPRAILRAPVAAKQAPVSEHVSIAIRRWPREERCCGWRCKASKHLRCCGG